MLADVPVIDYLSADPETQRKLQALMWLSQLGRYDSTTPYIRGVVKQPAESKNKCD